MIKNKVLKVEEIKSVPIPVISESSSPDSPIFEEEKSQAKILPSPSTQKFMGLSKILNDSMEDGGTSLDDSMRLRSGTQILRPSSSMSFKEKLA